jgi:hypothetical protein
LPAARSGLIDPSTTRRGSSNAFKANHQPVGVISSGADEEIEKKPDISNLEVADVCIMKDPPKKPGSEIHHLDHSPRGGIMWNRCRAWCRSVSEREQYRASHLPRRRPIHVITVHQTHRPQSTLSVP